MQIIDVEKMNCYNNCNHWWKYNHAHNEQKMKECFVTEQQNQRTKFISKSTVIFIYMN